MDLHGHYGGDLAASERALEAQLYYGVTTTRSIGSDSPDKVALMLETDAGRADLPRPGFLDTSNLGARLLVLHCSMRYTRFP